MKRILRFLGAYLLKLGAENNSHIEVVCEVVFKLRDDTNENIIYYVNYILKDLFRDRDVKKARIIKLDRVDK